MIDYCVSGHTGGSPKVPSNNTSSDIGESNSKRWGGGKEKSDGKLGDSNGGSKPKEQANTDGVFGKKAGNDDQDNTDRNFSAGAKAGILQKF